ncbi:hypothetical protein COO60DRAFT_518967 [Scenedesmus sp. NREL 46B-D3]|nr:hypothetical protein COO60DRAFT_518967 [Scenedesmus sp. NREL 46B-D3]
MHPLGGFSAAGRSSALLAHVMCMCRAHVSACTQHLQVWPSPHRAPCCVGLVVVWGLGCCCCTPFLTYQCNCERVVLQAARNRFNEFLHMASVAADEADVERLRRERREAAAKEVKGAAGTSAAKEEELPESFFKLPRIRFLLILCKEILRINKFIASFGEERFAAMDTQRSGIVRVVLVRSFVKAMSPTAIDAQVSENINVFVSTAEGSVRDMPPDQVAVPLVSELSLESFVAGVTGTLFVREHIKLNLLHPARLEEDDAEAQVFFSLLTVLLARHSSALLPYWQQALEAAGDRGRALQPQLSAVTAAGAAGDVRLKSYVNLLLGLINTSTQATWACCWATMLTWTLWAVTRWRRDWCALRMQHCCWLDAASIC